MRQATSNHFSVDPSQPETTPLGGGRFVLAYFRNMTLLIASIVIALIWPE